MEILTHPFTLFILFLIIFFVSCCFAFMPNIFLKMVFIPIAICSAPIIPSAFWIQYISEYGRNIPAVDKVVIQKCPISNLNLKQDDDGEYHYSFKSKYGIESGTDIKKYSFDEKIHFINSESYCTYQIYTYTEMDWARLDKVTTTISLMNIYVNDNYKIEIFND